MHISCTYALYVAIHTKSASIRVHEIEDELAGQGDAGDAEEEADGAGDQRDHGFAVPRPWEGVVDGGEDCLEQCKLRIQAQCEQHEEEEDGPELGVG